MPGKESKIASRESKSKTKTKSKRKRDEGKGRVSKRVLEWILNARKKLKNYH